MSKVIKVSKNFSIIEWQCRCGCGQCLINDDLVNAMQSLRDYVNRQVIIHCVNRCISHNNFVGGASGSQHPLGNAADFHVRGMDNLELHEIVQNNNFGFSGLGIYRWGVHADTRRGPYALWKGESIV